VRSIFVSHVIVFRTASEPHFEMSYEIKTGEAQSGRSGKRIKEK
jgi:hypothetical protein